jgi:hypothetical protein
MTRVRCTVDSCEFWSEGQVCRAETIWVKNNTGVEMDADMAVEMEMDDEMLFSLDVEFADETEDLLEYEGLEEELAGLDSARNSSQTCCHTMRLKESW